MGQCTEDAHCVGTKITKRASSAVIGRDAVKTDFSELVQISGHTGRVQSLDVNKVLRLITLFDSICDEFTENKVECLGA